MNKKQKTEVIQIRVSQKEKNLWKTRSKVRHEGNLSEFIRYCVENVDKVRLKIKKGP